MNQSQNSALFSRQSSSTDDTRIVSFVKDTYKLFGASLLAGATGAYLSLPYAPFLSANILWIAIPWMLFGMFGLRFVMNKPGVNIIALFGFTFISGVIITPLISHTLHIAGGGLIVTNAFLMTSALFGALSFFAIKTKSDFTTYTKPMIIAFFILLAGSLINIFVFKSPLLHVVIQGAFLLVISFMVLSDTQNVIKGAYQTPIEGALALYMDFFNMFTTLLQLFGIFGNSDD